MSVRTIRVAIRPMRKRADRTHMAMTIQSVSLSRDDVELDEEWVLTNRRVCMGSVGSVA